MLRLALIENLRRVAARIGADRVDRNRADYWADQMTAIAEKDPKSLILSIADMARSDPPMVGSFVAEFARRLQGKSPALALPLTWIEQRLSEDGLTIEQLVQSENQQQAADQVSISNSISSLRFLGAADWRDFVEARSGVEQTLREDPAGVYALMDFATRDQYRHVVETTARRSGRTEGEVARLAIELARRGRRDRRSRRRGRRTSGSTSSTRGSRSSNARRVRASPIGRDGAARVPRPPADALPREHRRPHAAARGGADRARLRGEGADGWLLGLVGVLLLLCASQVAVALVNAPGAPAGDAPRPAEDGPVGWHSRGLADAGRRPDADHERAERRAPGRGAGGALPRQPGRPRRLRPPDGPGRRRRRRRSRRTRPSSVWPSSGSRELNDKYRPRRSSSSTARGAGTPRNASGWATSASGESWPI